MATMTEEITIHSTKLTNNNNWYYMNLEMYVIIILVKNKVN